MSIITQNEADTPLKKGVAVLLQTLHTVCANVSVEVVSTTEFAVIIAIGDINITCVRHCADPSHICILVSINTTIVPYTEQETTPSYIQRVVAMITWQLNWKQLYKVFEKMPVFQSLEISKEESKGFSIKAVGDGLDEVAVIQGGSIVYCRIPLVDGHPNPTLMNQMLMLIPPESEETFYVRILATKNGFVGLHNYQDQRRVLSLSNNQGVVTKFIVKGISLFYLEQFITKPNKELGVIFTTGTPFSGAVGNLEFSCANFAVIRVGGEKYNIPTGQWASLDNILMMF
jgi:hypothetical protein